jgi:Ca2+-binding RTX toxin-like protein
MAANSAVITVTVAAEVDVIDGTAGANLLSGTAGDDSISGLAGDDTIRGNAGADSLYGGADVDWLDYRGSGAAVSVDLGTGVVSGGDAQGDVIVGFENVYGSALDDTLTGSAGSNLIRGGAGADSLNGGAGTDTLDYAGSAAGVSVDLGTGATSGGDAQGDVIAGFENIFGSTLGDTLTGNAGTNVIRGGVGADSLNGGAGSDWLDYRGSVAAVSINLGSGVVSGGQAQGDSIAGFENIYGSGLGDWLIGDAGTNQIHGGAGADTMDGGGGSDWLDYRGSAAAVSVDLGTGATSGGNAEGDVIVGFENLFGSVRGDTLTGSSGTNFIHGGAGADTMNGGAGSDWLDYRDSAAGVSVDLGTGVVSGGDAQGDVIAGFENLYGSRFGDTLTGNAGTNTLRGGAGADTMNGGAGLDWLDYRGSGAAVSVDLGTGVVSGGDAQGDVIAGFEQIYGSSFGDILAGSGAANIFTGGAGADRFVFNTALGSSNVDQITDFSAGVDRVDLAQSVFTGLATGALADAAFASNTTGLASDASDRILYETDTGRLYYDADGTGAGARVYFALITPALTLTSADFFVF